MPDSCAAPFIPVIRQGTAGSLLRVIPIKGMTFDWNTPIGQAEVPTGGCIPWVVTSDFHDIFLCKAFTQIILFINPSCLVFFLTIEIAMRWKNLLKWLSSQNGHQKIMIIIDLQKCQNGLKWKKKRSIWPLENPAMYPSMLCRPYSFHPVQVPKETGGLVPFCRNYKQRHM